MTWETELFPQCGDEEQSSPLSQHQALLQGMMLGLAIIGIASQQQGIRYDSQHILFKTTTGFQMEMTLCHAHPHVDSASIQVKWVYMPALDTFSTQES